MARQEMQGPRFRETVILVTPHHRGEVVGVVVNKPAGITISTLFPQSELKDEHSRQVYFGGPVSGQSLLFLIRSKKQPKASLRIFNDVFLSADRKVLQQVLRHPRPFAGLRVFSGYAGWKPGQLEAEVEKGYRVLRAADTEILFNAEQGLIWRKLLDSPDKGYQANLMEINLLSNLFQADYFRIRTVAQMQQSEIRGHVRHCKYNPDCVSLHPGYT